MKVRMITPGTMKNFKGMIIPGLYADMEAGLPVTAIGLTDDRTPIGAIAGVLENEHVFSIRSLFVSPDHRRMGGATLLTQALERLLDTKDALALISYLEEDTDESRSLTGFIESRDCVLENGLERLYRGTVGDFMRSGLFVKGFRNKEIKSLAAVDKTALPGVRKQIIQMVNDERSGSLAKVKHIMNLSYAAVKNDSLQGLLLCGNSVEHPEELVIRLSDNQDPHTTGGLLSTFLNTCSTSYGDDIYIRVPVADDRFDRMMGAIEGVRNIQRNFLF